MQQLLEIMQRLRDPDQGCPWDVEQDFASIAPFTIEEAYEVADAIARDNMTDLQDELGDLLFQVVFHAQMAKELGSFDFEDVHRSICNKMIRRHPHVFADLEIKDASHQKQVWEDYKAAERKDKGEHSLMDGIPAGMAELQRAVKLQKRAAKVGFDWADPGPVVDKFNEELIEIREAMASGDRDAMEDELGDLLLQVVFHAQMASEIGAFDFDAVAGAIAEKMIRRHPHVFAGETVANADAQRVARPEHL